MLGPADWVIWSLATLFEAAVVVCSVRKKVFRRYFFLNLYMLFSVLVSVGQFRVLMHYGAPLWNTVISTTTQKPCS